MCPDVNGHGYRLRQSFDEGSYDNYCLAGVKVRRMDQQCAILNALIFNCNDIGQLISVELLIPETAPATPIPAGRWYG